MMSLIESFEEEAANQIRAAVDREILESLITWEKWFAWRPVKLHGKWVCFKKIYRKPIPHTYVDYDDAQRYQYGTLFDVLKDS